MTKAEIALVVLGIVNLFATCVLGGYVVGVMRGELTDTRESTKRIEAAFLPAPGSLSGARERTNGAALARDTT